jgi:TetR/AcrR family transcriptional regulator, regulator of cefoperazone and chloramphenicol sensitivity
MGVTETPARVVIRDEALRLFAEYGADAVSLRRVAAAAGVSPGLVVHHFGGKDGLRAAVDEHAAEICEDVLGEIRRSARRLFDGDGPARPLAEGGGASFADALLHRLPPDSPVPLYLRRLLDDMVAAGCARPTRDHAVRSAFLVISDLAVLLLRDQLVEVLGVDPLTPEGMARWAHQALAVYRDGLLAEETDG